MRLAEGPFVEDLLKKDEEAVPEPLPTLDLRCRLRGAAVSRWQTEQQRPDHINPTDGLKGSPFASKHARCLSVKNALFVKWIKTRPPRTLPF